MNFPVTSTAFTEGRPIPDKYTCGGLNVSPPLQWDKAPTGVKSFALITDDPDAPMGTWVHWVLYNLPPPVNGLPEAVQKKDLPTGTREGLNDWKRTGYGGPCPPIGRHRYFFKLYALDDALPDLANPTKGQLEKAMQGHILVQAELIGTYEKKKR